MPLAPRTPGSRRLAAGAALVAACVAAVLIGRGVRRPWIPEAPAYRQTGAADARVVVVDFSDFQCGACAAAAATLKGVKSLYGDKVRVLFKHRPLQGHSWARNAAAVAECAGRQGKFWEMHDALFEKQHEWSSSEKPAEALFDYAQAAGLDPNEYLQCLEDPATLAMIDADVSDAELHWVQSTPTFFINGRRYVGPEQFRRKGLPAIDRLLKEIR